MKYILNLNFKDKLELEKFLLILNLGIIKMIKEAKMSAEDAINVFYRPRTSEFLKTIGINLDIIKIIDEFCEIDTLCKWCLEESRNKLLHKEELILKIYSLINTDFKQNQLYWIESLNEETFNIINKEFDIKYYEFYKSICKVCGWIIKDKPYLQNKENYYKRCDCCGYIYDEKKCNNHKAYEDYRKEWIENGAIWYDVKQKPKNWELQKQLKNIKLNLN